MSTLFVQLAPIEPERELKMLRNQAALVRTLLDGFDRAASPARAAGIRRSAAAQLAEEVGRLSDRMRACSDATARGEISWDWSADHRNGE